MKSIFSLIICLSFVVFLPAQEGLAEDYLSKEFHKNRREALRDKMSKNTVAVFFANPVRNRANDVEYVYHQDPNFYYLTGYKEPHAVLVIFSEMQTNSEGKTYDEMLYVQERNARYEMWTGRRLGTEGAKNELGFETAFNGKDFLNSGIDFTKFDEVLFDDFKDDYRDSKRNTADLHDLIESFKIQIGYYLEEAKADTNDFSNIDIQKETTITAQKANINTKTLSTFMGGLREVKTPEEMKLLTKAVRISAQGQIEVMKAMHSNMSETELQGIHEFVYKKYGSEYEGYPSIVGAGNNGCVLHYVDNNKMKIEGELVLMDLGAEYHGYTADVTRTIPASGKFSPEQKAIYDIVYNAQEAGIAAAIIGNNGNSTHNAGLKIINEGLFKLGIIKSTDERHMYFPHGTSHHIGLDVHDLSNYGNYKANMVITVEPGIYIPNGSDCDKKWWGIAVRIEDDILITENGPVNLSAEAPRKSNEIEALMKQSSIFGTYKLPKLD